MVDGQDRLDARRFAVTDLYDPVRRTFLVQYPKSLVLGIVISGPVAIFLTGFFGYAGERFPSYLFLQPWPLYLWLCALALLLEVSVMRHPAMRRQLVTTFLWSVISMTLVGIIYFSSPRLVFAISLLGTQADHAVLTLGQQAVTYTVVNAGLLLLYWTDRVLSWTYRRPRRESEQGLRLRYLIALDLLTGALLAALLALALQPALLTVLSRLLKVNITVSACMVAVPGTCTPTLSQLDWVAAGGSLATGLLILVTSLALAGIRRLRGGARASTEREREHLGLRQILALEGRDRGRLREGILRLLGKPGAQLRPILVPVLLFAGSISLASSARAIQVHLHANDTLVGFDLGALVRGITLNAISNALPGLIEGPVGFTFFVAAMAILMFRWRVFANTREYISMLNLLWRLTAWLFFLVFFLLNWLGLQVRLTRHHPFDALSLTAIYSFVFLVYYGVSIIIRRRRVSQRIARATIQ